MSTAQERIKAAFWRLLREQAYSKITVTQICKTAGISRVTFYIWYEDKESLINDLFQDMADDGVRYYNEQKPNYKKYGLAESCGNILETIFYLHGKYPFLLMQVYETPEAADRSLYHRYHYLIIEQITSLTEESFSETLPPLSTKEIVTFICNGLSSMIQVDAKAGKSLEEIKSNAALLLDKVLKSGLFV